MCFCRPLLHPPPSRLSLGDSDERKEASLHIKGRRRRRFVCCLGLRRTGEGQHRVLPNEDGENCISPVYFCFWESARRNFLLAPGRRRKEGKKRVNKPLPPSPSFHLSLPTTKIWACSRSLSPRHIIATSPLSVCSRRVFFWASICGESGGGRGSKLWLRGYDSGSTYTVHVLCHFSSEQGCERAHHLRIGLGRPPNAPAFWVDRRT